MMLETEARERQPGHDVKRHHAESQIFAGRQRLDENRQHGQLDQADRMRQQKPQQVVADLEVEVPPGSLERQRAQHCRTVQRDQHDGDRQDLRQQERPVGDRARVDDLMDPPLAIAPHQLAAVIDRHDRRDFAERVVERLDGVARHRVGRVAVLQPPEPEPAERDDEPDQEQHEEGGAPQDAADIQADSCPEQLPALAEIEARRCRCGW